MEKAQISFQLLSITPVCNTPRVKEDDIFLRAGVCLFYNFSLVRDESKWKILNAAVSRVFEFTLLQTYMSKPII